LLKERNLNSERGSFLSCVGSFAVENHRTAALALDSPDLRITMKAIFGLGHTQQVQCNRLTSNT